KRVDTKTLRRIKENTTQTKKSVFERYENTAGIFEVKNKETFENMHVLLVDDVLTTGSTIEAAIQALKECEGVKVSIFTLAMA
ncbi:ComF family protein, partial [bacterium]|nr:ComF family protein [bacterium]